VKLQRFATHLNETSQLSTSINIYNQQYISEVKSRDSVLSQNSLETHLGCRDLVGWCLGLGLVGWCLGLGLVGWCLNLGLWVGVSVLKSLSCASVKTVQFTLYFSYPTVKIRYLLTYLPLYGTCDK